MNWERRAACIFALAERAPLAPQRSCTARASLTARVEST